ncbi:unnamed protein product [Clonostachys byssicola]|uniref:Rhamnogalacturonase A/B/Epimerase-like pectate lyase domain-containing protein n=1 Tax=Clonostachys byssicola TaxID=160290 RepID=A0A9N9UPE5_9HYPO|nr:unnamed protein product [Clonostachys byssicola]
MRPAEKEPKLAPPLNYGQNSSSARIFSSGKLASNSTSPYSIPEEIREAARKVAESTPQIPKGDHSEVAAAIKQKYRSNNNDTNAPEPLEPPDGKLGQWATSTSNMSSKVSERDSGYWMVDMAKRGQSPFAPSGYKVWRNVKDYGAKGDGKTDDTAAINKAISDGGRCGPDCGSSSLYPATVYFPPGTYLVSSSIIQYYNTEFLGDPINVPTILAASSFVGLGVMTSDVYISDDESWNTDPTAYICGIHWQVAQASSLENIEFYMLYNSEVPQNTQQGIYMENGSGGFLADLTFVGGNFGAYFGNQQFTTSRLVFVNCKTAVQVHWDWAWTMHDFVIESCGTGLVIVGGAGGPMSTGQGVGSLILVDSIIANTGEAIVTSLVAENSTSFLLQNVGFFNVQTAIKDSFKNNAVLLPGGNEVIVESWGFGKISNATTNADGNVVGRESFIHGGEIPAMARSEVLLGGQKDKMGRDIFTRRRPKYYDVPQQRIMDVMALGAKGDGKTDDTPVLNAILDGAANTSSIVYFPHGVYIIKDTLRVPVGSRIIGQAWPQIMMSGDPNFLNEEKPQVGIQVGRPGEQGIVEIQGMMFSQSGATAGLIMMEWNVKDSTQGSAGMWDSHFRVGGAIGTKMLLEDCPKKTGSINPRCKGASLMMHLTPESSAYLENIWIWVADHDLDKKSQDQIDVFVGRGLLVESTHAWLWGTSVEHATESPYFQPVPPAPQPFKTGLFPNDPTFASCANNNEKGCATSWAVRIVDSSAIYMLGAGIYSWFYDYSKTCEDTRNCQQRAFEVEQSSDIWIYNLCTFAIVEMISPLGSVATKAADNVNGFLSSILAWLQGAGRTSGEREFEGFQVYDAADVGEMRNKFPEICNTALTQRIDCESTVEGFAKVSHHGTLGNDTLTDLVCQTGCGKSLKSWYDNVESSCSGYKLDNGALPVLLGARMYAGYNETCLKDESTGRYCNDIISEFTVVHNYTAMPERINYNPTSGDPRAPEIGIMPF